MGGGEVDVDVVGCCFELWKEGLACSMDKDLRGSSLDGTEFVTEDSAIGAGVVVGFDGLQFEEVGVVFQGYVEQG